MTRRAWLAFAGISLIWGIPYLFIAVALRGGIPPFPLAWGRVLLAAAALLAAGARAGVLGQLAGRWRWVLAYAVAEICVPFPLIALGEQHLPSSLAAITIASVPLIVALLALRFDHAERPTRRRGLGLACGFLGVVALVGLDAAARPGELLGLGALLLAALGYSAGPMILKHRLAGIDGRAAMGASLALAALLLTPAAALDWPERAPSAAAWASLGILGLLCTAVAFLLLVVLVREAGTARASIITYVNPVVAVALGVVVLGERPRAGSLVGLVLILAGSWLATGGRAGRRAPAVRRRPPASDDSRPAAHEDLAVVRASG